MYSIKRRLCLILLILLPQTGFDWKVMHCTFCDLSLTFLLHPRSDSTLLVMPYLILCSSTFQKILCVFFILLSANLSYSGLSLILFVRCDVLSCIKITECKSWKGHQSYSTSCQMQDSADSTGFPDGWPPSFFLNTSSKGQSTTTRGSLF